jgi:hypothetical protein
MDKKAIMNFTQSFLLSTKQKTHIFKYYAYTVFDGVLTPNFLAFFDSQFLDKTNNTVCL